MIAPAGQSLSQELLASVKLKVLAIERMEAGSWWNYREVSSPFSRLWLPLKGDAKVKHHGRTHTLSPGILHLIPVFTLHNCACPSYFQHYYLHFVARLPTGLDLFSLLYCDSQVQAPDNAQAMMERLEAVYPNLKLPCFDPTTEEYRRFPARAEQAGEEVSSADWFEAQGLLRLLIAPFLRSARSLEGVHARATRRFLAVQEFIHERMRKPITLADMARVAGLHPTYFSDRFYQQVGVRPTEYLQRRRIERAQYLLLTGRGSVKEVAFEVGIPDPAYFTRLFTHRCKASPSAYRAAHGL